MTRPVRCFISYSRHDDAYRLELEKHLKPLRRAGLLETWSDQAIDAGTEWEQQIHDSLDTAEIILLLVSADFLASDFCWEIEVKKAMARHEAGSAKVIPVFVHPCHWKGAPFEKLQGVPDPKVPISEWDNRNRAFTFVAEAVHKAAEEMSARRVPTSSAPVPLAPGTVFRDFPDGPELVVIPPGKFLMGSPGLEAERFEDEGPQHSVTIGYPLAVGRFPVTRGEFAAFVATTGHATPGGAFIWKETRWTLDPARDWRSPGFDQTDRHPAVCVNWQDAQAYVAWLVQHTGKPYRLLSEAEWEYACRAGTATRYWWGDPWDPAKANGANNVGKTTEVGAYPANDFGLYDMLGNAWEWVEDVWHDSYDGAPADGSAWTDGLGSNSDPDRVVRGGCWYGISWDLRSAYRGRNHPDDRDIYLGFRVARTL